MKVNEMMRGFYFVVSVMASMTLIFGVLAYTIFELVRVLS